LQRKRFLNNNNPELGSESENTSKQKKSSKFRRGRKDRSPHKQTSSTFMELIFSLNHQNRHSQAPKKNTHTHKSTPFGQIFGKKEHLTELFFGENISPNDKIRHKKNIGSQFYFMYGIGTRTENFGKTFSEKRTKTRG
jgi:hypothetical protein